MAKHKVRGAVDRIDRRNLIFYIMYYYVRTIFFHFYRKVEVNGLENIPKDVPVIFAPNHQNALMDALIVLYSSPGDTVFLARADLFKKKTLAYIFNSLKMLPVFRIRDGVEELGKNQEIFDITVGVLQKNHQLCLMPEGNHAEKRKLRRLVKGIFRIAFKAQEPMGNKPYVKIVPVGLDFSNQVKHYQKLQVNYGKPIEVSEYWDEHEENAPRAVNSLKHTLEGKMKELMIHIETDDFYDLLFHLRTILNDRMREAMGIEGKKLRDRMKADQEMIARMEKVIEEDEAKVVPLREKVAAYEADLQKLNYRDWVVKNKGISRGRVIGRSLILLATLPVFIYGFLNNAIMYLIPPLAVRKMKDRMFHSSIKMGVAMLVSMPVSYIAQTALVVIFTHTWWIGLIYLASLNPMGHIALRWYMMAKKTWFGAKFGTQFRKNKTYAQNIVQLRSDIVTQAEHLIL